MGILTDYLLCIQKIFERSAGCTVSSRSLGVLGPGNFWDVCVLRDFFGLLGPQGLLRFLGLPGLQGLNGLGGLKRFSKLEVVSTVQRVKRDIPKVCN